MMKRKDLVVFFCVFFVVFLQYGLHNIFNLGLVGDDWDLMLPVYMKDASDFKVFFDYQFSKGLVSLERPFWITVMAFENYLFGSHIYLYHFVSAGMLVAVGFLIYLCIKKMFHLQGVAVLAAMIFVSFPNHVAAMYWIAGQLSLFAFVLGILGWYFSLSERVYMKFFIAPLILFLSATNYENIFALFMTIFVFDFIEFLKEGDVKKFLVKVFPLVESIGLFFIYRIMIIQNYLDVIPYKEPTFDISSSVLFERFQLFVSHFMGSALFQYIANFYDNLFRLADLSSFIFVALLSLMLFVFIYLTLRYLLADLKANRDMESDSVFSFAFILLTSSFLILLPTYRDYDLGALTDRVNLPPTLAISIIGGYLFQKLLKKRMLALFVLLLAFFTLINWTYLGSFIRSYKTQLSFIDTALNYPLEENSLFFVDTDVYDTNEIVTLNRAWAFTYMVSSASGIDHIEYVGPSTQLYTGENYRNYESKYYKDYVYKNPKLYLIEFAN